MIILLDDAYLYITSFFVINISSLHKKKKEIKFALFIYLLLGVRNEYLILLLAPSMQCCQMLSAQVTIATASPFINIPGKRQINVPPVPPPEPPCRLSPP